MKTDPEAGSSQGAQSGATGLVAFALRLGVIGGATIAGLGFADHYIAWPFLTSSLGPTAYVFIAHPSSPSARLRNAAVGHTVGIGAGLAGLVAFGLWHAPSVAKLGHATFDQAAASGLAVAITLVLLHLLRAHHAPAAASTILVSTGLARPGLPLYGLVLGLAALVIVGPLLARIPLPPHPERYTDQS